MAGWIFAREWGKLGVTGDVAPLVGTVLQWWEPESDQC